ncbi:hypothetical protein [Constantimarinum furrinae]|nr:hypothetical protein [Constantimarinum furrinae]
MFLGINTFSQEVKVDSTLRFDSTNIVIKDFDSTYRAYTSFDNQKSDSLIVTIGNHGLSGVLVKLNFNEYPKLELFLWSDTNEFSGKNTMKIAIDEYSLEINSTKFQRGDTIMGRIKGKSEIISNSFGNYQIEFQGQFRHIVGKILKKREADQNYIIIDN